MKNIGIARKSDELGRLCIPKELRKQLGMDEKTFIQMYIEDDMICLKPIAEQCLCCGNTHQNELIVTKNKKTLCINCANEVLSLFNENKIKK